MKLWDKNTTTDEMISSFTIGNDRELDMVLAGFDALGSIAHVQMLGKVGLLSADESQSIKTELINIYQAVQQKEFTIDPESEDVHTQIEVLLIQRLGETGKKVHSGRSRNDQVLVALKLFIRDEIEQLVGRTKTLFDTLTDLSHQHQDTLMPGYTHMQVAMVSSFGLWFGAYAEALADDLRSLQAAYQLANLNPLGSAAGYGSSFPLDRAMTTRLLGFQDMHYNVINAQMSRGKTELAMSYGMATLASTLNKLATDICLYMGQDFGFISFPDSLTTGSSIMPHKKNPDVWELIRGHCNRLAALPVEISMMIHNLPAGYHRDFQLLKDVLFPKIQSIKSCLDLADFMLRRIIVRPDLVKQEKYQYLFTVEEVNKLVLSGVPFRDAYKQVGLDIEQNKYLPDYKIHHTHEGSLGNLCLEEIKAKMESIVYTFDFDTIHQHIEDLLKND